MTIIIIERKITYSQALKELLLVSFPKAEIELYRDFSQFNSLEKLTNEVVIFEATEENSTILAEFLHKKANHNLTFIALTDTVLERFSLETILMGVSSILRKSQPIENLCEEVKLILRGSEVIPKNLFNEIKAEIKKTKSEKESRFSTFLKNILIKN